MDQQLIGGIGLLVGILWVVSAGIRWRLKEGAWALAIIAVCVILVFPSVLN